MLVHIDRGYCRKIFIQVSVRQTNWTFNCRLNWRFFYKWILFCSGKNKVVVTKVKKKKIIKTNCCPFWLPYSLTESHITFSVMDILRSKQINFIIIMCVIIYLISVRMNKLLAIINSIERMIPHYLTHLKSLKSVIKLWFSFI